MSYQLVPTVDQDHITSMDPSALSSVSSREAMSPTLLSPTGITKLSNEQLSNPSNSTSTINQTKPNLAVTTKRPDSTAAQVTVQLGSVIHSPASSIGSHSHAFINIRGIPSGDDTSLVDTVVVHSANIDSPKPKFPQLSPNSAEKHLVDVIDAEDEDPFTLESFNSLLEISANQGKDFIIARVVTVDPQDESKFYHSYYAAHHINKVLFRTQPEEGLLHRMKAKNPLNNMTIVGDVHYYCISPNAYRAARAHIPSTSPQSPIHSRRNRLFGKKKKTIAEMIRDILLPHHPSVSDCKRKLRLVVTEPDKVLDIDTNDMAATNTNRSPAGKLHELKQVNNTNNKSFNGRRPSADDIYAFVSKSSPIEEKIVDGLVEVDLAYLTPPPLITSPVSDIHLQKEKLRLGDEQTERGRTTYRTNVRNNLRSKSTTAAHIQLELISKFDWVHQFYSRSRAQFNTQPYKVKVRSTSYRNERLLSVNNDQPAHILSVEEWVSIHCGDNVTELLISKPIKQYQHNGNNKKEAINTNTSSVSLSPNTVQSRQRHLIKLNSSSNSVSPKVKTVPIKYEATFFATDDDYLMKSSVRAYFKQHAIESDDAVLFSIPSSTTVVLPQTGDTLEPHPALNGFSYSIEGNDDDILLGSGLGVRVRRFFRDHHVLKFSLLLYIIAGSLLIKFLVPENLTYLVTFLLVFILCFFLVFFVECDV